MQESVMFLQLSLHGRLVGYLTGFQHGKNILYFAPEFYTDEERPTLSLLTHPQFPNAEKLLNKPWQQNQRLHPLLSNLLPEGALRTLIAQGLKVHIDNEFQLFSYLRSDLPGALIAEPVVGDNVPDYVLKHFRDYQVVPFAHFQQENRFSLAGVQMKFSMRAKGERYTLTHDGKLGDWIIKTPSVQHKAVPQNEFVAMKLAKIAGVTIPEIKLIQLSQLDNLPAINLPDESFAFAIKRFDRNNEERIHSEDFAQVLAKYPHEKYQGANYEQIGKILYTYSGDKLADIQQFARRLLVNILLANGDAHLKNWSLIYPDQFTPRLSPAYDIVTTRAYIADEQHFALNLGKQKQWYQTNLSHFEYWVSKVGVPWRAIEPHLQEVLTQARDEWKAALTTLPVSDEHQQVLLTHWQRLHKDFRL